jgi:hypothetical protein
VVGDEIKLFKKIEPKFFFYLYIIMDYVLMRYYPDNVWICGDTYESLIWKDTTTEKPTEEELNIKWKELKKENMREERNQLLKDCDFRVLPDYPDTNKEACIIYRHNLRTLPETWSEGIDFPTKPE